MLRVKSTENTTGIIISGNYDDMNELYNALIIVIGSDDDYSYQAASRQRVLFVCNEIRHAYSGERETLVSNNNIPYYAFRILWPEAAFVAAILDNFVLLSIAKKLYIAHQQEPSKEQIQIVTSDHISLIHYFQDLVWNELERIVGSKRVRAIFGEYNDLRSMHFKYPQFDGYYTQWLDLLNIKYLCSKPEQRSSYLSAILSKLFLIDEDYLSLKQSINVYAKQKGILVTGVKLADWENADTIEW